MGHGLFFESQGDPLYGFLHPAEGGPGRSGVVFVHGAFEERQDAHLVARDAAARLAACGHHCLRFDLFGHGDSTGEFEEATLTRWVDDTVAACRTLRAETGCERVALVGLRAGSLVAARAAEALAASEPTVDRLLFWSPVIDGRAYVLETLRGHLASEMVMHRRAGGSRDELIAQLESGQPVNVFGYRLGAALFRELCAARLAESLAQTTAPVRFLDVVRTPQARGSADLDALAAALGERAGVERVVESQLLHTEGKLFYARADNVVAASQRFLETTGS